MSCKYRVIGKEVGVYYFYDLQSAVDFFSNDGVILQYFNEGEWKDVEAA